MAEKKCCSEFAQDSCIPPGYIEKKNVVIASPAALEAMRGLDKFHKEFFTPKNPQMTTSGMIAPSCLRAWKAKMKDGVMPPGPFETCHHPYNMVGTQEELYLLPKEDPSLAKKEPKKKREPCDGCCPTSGTILDKGGMAHYYQYLNEVTYPRLKKANTSALLLQNMPPSTLKVLKDIKKTDREVQDKIENMFPKDSFERGLLRESPLAIMAAETTQENKANLESQLGTMRKESKGSPDKDKRNLIKIESPWADIPGLENLNKDVYALPADFFTRPPTPPPRKSKYPKATRKQVRHLLVLHIRKFGSMGMPLPRRRFFIPKSLRKMRPAGIPISKPKKKVLVTKKVQFVPGEIITITSPETGMKIRIGSADNTKVKPYPKRETKEPVASTSKAIKPQDGVVKPPQRTTKKTPKKSEVNSTTVKTSLDNQKEKKVKADPNDFIPIKFDPEKWSWMNIDQSGKSPAEMVNLSKTLGYNAKKQMDSYRAQMAAEKRMAPADPPLFPPKPQISEKYKYKPSGHRYVTSSNEMLKTPSDYYLKPNSPTEPAPEGQSLSKVKVEKSNKKLSDYLDVCFTKALKKGDKEKGFRVAGRSPARSPARSPDPEPLDLSRITQRQLSKKIRELLSNSPDAN